ncbi:MAG: ATP-binding protein [Alphaproteobacteria bacterium]
MNKIGARQASSLIRGGGNSKRAFPMVRWIMLASFVVIGLISVTAATLLSGFLTRHMLDRDAQVLTQMVNAIVRVQGAHEYFVGDAGAVSANEMEAFFRQMAQLPDVIRANVYGDDRRILWSSDRDLIGRSFADNEDLELAFQGQSTPEVEVVRVGDKAEHIEFPEDVTQFVENYVPIWSADRSRVLGAVEFYTSPTELLAVIDQGRNLVWIGAAVAALALYVALFLVVSHASQNIRQQEERLIESERMAVVGEMASAVAHGLRNPLAAIRSSAELLLLDDLPPSWRQSISDIVSQSDRLETWIRAMLTRARENPSEAARLAQLDQVIRDGLETYAAQMRARGIGAQFDCEGHSPLIAGSPSELRQVLNSIFANAIEAMDGGGELRVVRTVKAEGWVRISVTDTGKGIPDTMKKRVFEPFATDKSSGLGVGLPLARRIVERLGGSIDIADAQPCGTEVVLHLPGQGSP